MFVRVWCEVPKVGVVCVSSRRFGRLVVSLLLLVVLLYLNVSCASESVPRVTSALHFERRDEPKLI